MTELTDKRGIFLAVVVAVGVGSAIALANDENPDVYVGVAIPEPVHRVVELDPKAKEPKVSVYGFPYVQTALIMPEGFSSVRCSNCTLKTGKDDGEELTLDPNDASRPKKPKPKLVAEAWQLERDDDAHKLYIKPTRFPNNEPGDISNFLATIHVTLDSGYSLGIVVNLVSPLDERPPDLTVVFTLPGAAKYSGKLAEADARREERFLERVRAEATDMLLDFLLGRPECKKAAGAPYVTEKLYVRLRWTCVTTRDDTKGNDDRAFWVIFSVTNSGTTKVVMDDAILSGESGTSSADGGISQSKFDRPTIRNRKSTLAIAATLLPPGASPPAKWHLSVREEGGAERVVNVGNITF